VRIDHVVLAVRDLDEAGDRLLAATGLASVAGGRHPGWGTANRIVPLGDDYVELLSVVDPEVGATTMLGRTLLSLTEDGRDRWFSVCLAVPAIDDTAARLGLAVEPGSRTRPDGTQARWRGAGIEDPSRPAWLPFFIAWDLPPEEHPGRTLAAHRVAPTGIVRVDVEGEASRLEDWLGGADVPISCLPADGPPRVRSVTVGLAGGGEIMIAGAR
jgi:catechol 2,3-dioxygenase-like lactoylglutathione lyase family enzyme